MQKIKISSGNVLLTASLLDTPTAKSIYEKLPIESRAQTWGDEVYFEVPINVEREPSAKDVIEPGEIAFWVEGRCIAIGFGRTPISLKNEIRLAAKTNIWATTSEDVKQLSAVRPGQKIRIEKLD